jgi:hypothetical protein
MSVARTSISLIVVGLVAAAGTQCAIAQTAATQSAAPVRVNKCDPVQGTTTISGFTPGYYPAAGRYSWRDPYGHRFYQYPLGVTAHTSNPTLGIDFVNTGTKPLKEVEFGLVAKGVLVAEVRDVGTFSPGAEIKHEFGLNPNVFPLGTGLPQCVPLRATHDDGTIWTNPHLPKLKQTIYQ